MAFPRGPVRLLLLAVVVLILLNAAAESADNGPTTS
jgi:hypothetical protein